MAIPDFQAIMLPFLHLLADGKEHQHKDLIKGVADHFNLSEEERQELLPSQRQAIIANRVGWARTHLSKAGLIKSPARGIHVITPRGQASLNDTPQSINMQFLMQYPEYRAFRGIETPVGIEPAKPAIIALTPQETMSSAYVELNKALTAELLETIQQQTPGFFEQLVLDLLLAMGYGGSREDAAQVVGKSGDEGIDGIIKQDRLGLDIIYVQAKRWKDNVGGPVVQAFIGALHLRGAQRGILITTSGFSQQARELAAKAGTRVILIDGTLLAQLMIEHNIGVSVVNEYKIKRIDSDYFSEDAG